ncbi:MAG: RNA polymerase sigma factor [Steroidobacteraceae bacterium]
MPEKEKHALVYELAARQSEHLRRFLRPRVRNANDIPDLIQETFLRLLRAPDHDTIRMPEAYLFTIARHVAQQHALRTTAEMQVRDLEQMLEDLNSATDCDPALEVTAQQCVEQLDDVFGRLSPKVQATFLLHRRDGLSIDEISAKLGVSRPMTKKYLVKALVAFRKRLQDGQ